ncbi:hypothetical protein AV530_000056 [Patagioenas fasciata monilis]|uniref:Uncharacterized protein n=1 Tax=Patagioenas fasciata monilis TaxID=372326 RepID=A0A1V4K050_PATFA|nr:hypothetical protein AV530_000056 [Patagioenas fasciata monilis]
MRCRCWCGCEGQTALNSGSLGFTGGHRAFGSCRQSPLGTQGKGLQISRKLNHSKLIGLVEINPPLDLQRAEAALQISLPL